MGSSPWHPRYRDRPTNLTAVFISRSALTSSRIFSKSHSAFGQASKRKTLVATNSTSE